jgi:hypothetical protein
MPILTASSCARAALALAFAGVLCAAGCGGRQSVTAPPGTTPPHRTSPGGDDEVRGSFTPEQCAAAGGEVVGDIGDGAVRTPDYRCPKSGHRPIGTIVTEPGQPIGVEGAVCCR